MLHLFRIYSQQAVYTEEKAEFQWQLESARHINDEQKKLKRIKKSHATRYTFPDKLYFSRTMTTKVCDISWQNPPATNNGNSISAEIMLKDPHEVTTKKYHHVHHSIIYNKRILLRK